MGIALFPCIEVMESGDTIDIIDTALHNLEDLGGGGQIHRRDVPVIPAQFQDEVVVGKMVGKLWVFV